MTLVSHQALGGGNSALLKRLGRTGRKQFDCARALQYAELLSLPDDLMQHVLIEVAYGGPIEARRYRGMPPLDALEKQCSRDENPGARLVMDYFRGQRYLPPKTTSTAEALVPWLA